MGRICDVDGCGKPHLGHGFCKSHYRKMRRGTLGQWKMRRITPEKMDPAVALEVAKGRESSGEEVVVGSVLNGEEVRGMSFLPEWMRWSVLHPGLLHTLEDVLASDSLRGKCEEYLDNFPCPHQAAMNQFMLYRGNPKMLDGLFKEIQRQHAAAMKAGNATDKKSQEMSEEEKAIVTLEDLFKEALE